MQWKSAICAESPNNKMWHSVVLSHIHLFNHICKCLNSTSNRAILSLLFQYFWMALCVYIYIYIYIYIYTLTGHFIRYTLRVPGWTPFFAFRTTLIIRGIDSTRCWKHYSKILVHIDMIASLSCCRIVVCTSMMRISHSTTSQRCSIVLRSGDSGGHLSEVNSLSCSRNQSEMI